MNFLDYILFLAEDLRSTWHCGGFYKVEENFMFYFTVNVCWEGPRKSIMLWIEFLFMVKNKTQYYDYRPFHNSRFNFINKSAITQKTQ